MSVERAEVDGTAVRVVIVNNDKEKFAVLLKLEQLFSLTEGDITIDVATPVLVHKSSKRLKSGKEDVAQLSAYIKAHSEIVEHLVTSQSANAELKKSIALWLSKEVLDTNEFSLESWWVKGPLQASFKLFALPALPASPASPKLYYSTERAFKNPDLAIYSYDKLKVDQALSVAWTGDFVKLFADMGCSIHETGFVGSVFPLVIAESKRWKSQYKSKGIVYSRQTPVDGVLNETVLYADLLLHWICDKLPNVAAQAIIVGVTQRGPDHIVTWNTVKHVAKRTFTNDVVFKGEIDYMTPDALLWQFQRVINESIAKTQVFVQALIKLNAIVVQKH